MRILLDESLPNELQSEIPGHEVRTVREAGWKSNPIEDLRPLIPELLRLLAAIAPRTLTQIGG